MVAFAEIRDAAVPEVVLETWQRVVDGWEEPVRHDELLRLVTNHGCYAWAAARYRDAIRARKADAIGEGQLDRVRRAAEAALYLSATPKPDPTEKPYRSTIAILGVLVIIMAMGLVYALVFHEPPAAPAHKQLGH